MKNIVVPVLKDDGRLSGSAFLFRKDEKVCYWMTCHHVVAKLKEIKLFYFCSSEEVTAFYDENLSAPEKDIAVLTTDSHIFSEYEPVCMGKVYPNIYDARSGYPDGEGYILGFDEDAFSRQRKEKKIELSFAIGNEQILDIHDDENKKIIENLGSLWNVEIPDFEMLFLDMFKSRREISEGLSGSPLFAKGTDFDQLCIGMVTQSTHRDIGTDSLEGVAIPYEEIEKVLGPAIPFFNYSDCVIVVLAGKRCEFSKKPSAEKGIERIDSYHNDDRELWKPFGNNVVKNLVQNTLDNGRKYYQMSSVYIDANNKNEFDNFIEDGVGALIFLVDKSSLDIEELQEIIAMADNDQKRSSYFIVEPVYKDSHRQTFEERMPRVSCSRILGKRKESCNDEQSFRTRVERIFDEAIDHSERLSGGLTSTERKLNAISAPKNYFFDLPRMKSVGYGR